MLTFGTAGAQGAVRPPPAARRREDVPALLRAGRRVRPRRAADPRRARRRRVGRQRPEGVDVGRQGGRVRHARRPHELGRPEAPRHLVLLVPDAPARRRRPPDPPDHRREPLQRGVPRRRPRPGRPPRRPARRRVAGAADGARLRALGDGRRRPRPAQRRRRPRATARSIVGERRPSAPQRPPGPQAAEVDLWALAKEMGQRPTTRSIRQAIARVHELRMVNAWNGLRAKAQLEQGSSSPILSLGKLAMSRILHEGAHVQRLIVGAEALLYGTEQPARRRRQLPVAERLLHVDRRRHRPDPAQHHRRARARPAARAGGRPRRAVPRRHQGHRAPPLTAASAVAPGRCSCRLKAPPARLMVEIKEISTDMSTTPVAAPRRTTSTGASPPCATASTATCSTPGDAGFRQAALGLEPGGRPRPGRDRRGRGRRRRDRRRRRSPPRPGIGLGVQATGHGVALPGRRRAARDDAGWPASRSTPRRARRGSRPAASGARCSRRPRSTASPRSSARRSPSAPSATRSAAGSAGWPGSYGPSCDAVRSLEVVTPRRRAGLRLAATSNAELFHALRGGGGGSLGVVTEMEVAAVPGDDRLRRRPRRTRPRPRPMCSTRWSRWVADAPDELTSSVVLRNGPNGPRGDDRARLLERPTRRRAGPARRLAAGDAADRSTAGASSRSATSPRSASIPSSRRRASSPAGGWRRAPGARHPAERRRDARRRRVRRDVGAALRRDPPRRRGRRHRVPQRAAQLDGQPRRRVPAPPRRRRRRAATTQREIAGHLARDDGRARRAPLDAHVPQRARRPGPGRRRGDVRSTPTTWRRSPASRPRSTPADLLRYGVRHTTR